MGVKSKSYTKYTITNGGGTINLSPKDGTSIYIFEGTATLTNNWVVQYDPAYSITPQEGMRVEIIWNGNVDLNGRSITILGTSLTQEEAGSIGTASYYYDGSQWQSYWLVEGNQSVDIDEFTVTSSTTDTLNPSLNSRLLLLKGAVTLTGDYTLALGGTPDEGDSFKVLVPANVTLDGNTLTIFGEVIDEDTALAGGYKVETLYDGSSWNTVVTGLANKTYLDIPTVLQITANTTATGPSFVEVDASSSNIIVTLPPAAINTGLTIIVTKTDSTANTVTVNPDGAETINGAANFILEVQEESITAISNGTNWRII